MLELASAVTGNIDHMASTVIVLQCVVALGGVVIHRVVIVHRVARLSLRRRFRNALKGLLTEVEEMDKH